MGTLDETALLQEGFTVVDLLDRADVRRAQGFIERFDLGDHHGFFASPAHAYGEPAYRFHSEIKELLRPRLSELVPGRRQFLAGVTSKGSLEGSPINFHHDWTYTDERRERAVFFWCPLVDAGPENGGLSVVPRSHTWFDGIRPRRPSEITEPHQRALAERAVEVSISAGQAIAFDPAVLHGSGPNHSERSRPAFTVAVVPTEAQLVHFHLGDDGVFQGAEVDERFFTCHPYRAAPDGYPAIDPWAPVVSEDDVLRGLAGD